MAVKKNIRVLVLEEHTPVLEEYKLVLVEHKLVLEEYKLEVELMVEYTLATG